MTIEDVIYRAITARQSIIIEYCTRHGNVFTCEITDIRYSNCFGTGYIQAYRRDIGEDIQDEQDPDSERSCLLQDLLEPIR